MSEHPSSLDALYSGVQSIVVDLERSVQSKEERILFLEKELLRKELTLSDAPPNARLSDLFRAAGMALPESPSPSEAPQAADRSNSSTSPPKLSSRLSASGTDFSSFSTKRRSKQAAALVQSSGPFGPVPVDVRQNRRQSDSSSSLGNRKVHHNDVNALSLKTRRLQKQPIEMSESSEQIDIDSHMDQSDLVVGHAINNEDSSVSPAPSPVQSPQISRLTRRSGSLNGAQLPDSNAVKAALLERTSPTSSADQGNALTLRVESKSPSGHNRSRSGDRSSFRQRFKSAFPGRSSAVLSSTVSPFEESGPIAGGSSADGGFQAHQVSFSGKPLFSSSGGLHIIESYISDGQWTWDPLSSALLQPEALPLSEIASGEISIKCWVWKKGSAIIFAQIGEQGNVIITSVWPQGTVRATTRISNARLMSPDELAAAVLFVAGPHVPLIECERARGQQLAQLRTALGAMETRMRKIIDIDVVEIGDFMLPSSSNERKKSGRLPRANRRSGVTQSLMERLQTALLCQDEPEADWPLSYQWNDFEFRLNHCPTLNRSTHPLVLCLLCDSDALVPQPPPSVRVVVAVRPRDASTWEIACCRSPALRQFGPPFFQAPLKDKRLHGVISAKFSHAAQAIQHAMRREITETRRAVLATLLDDSMLHQVDSDDSEN